MDIDSHRYRLFRSGVLAAMFLLCRVIFSPAAEDKKSAGLPVPGQEAEIQMPDNGRTMKVYLPSNYSPARLWPVIFFFHGKNAGPTTSPVKEYVGGNDFVIVGMPYAAENEVPKNQQEIDGILQKELANFRSARAWAGQNLRIDEKRVFMGGISLGGWATSTLAEYEMPRLSGMFILLAGRQRAKTIPKEAAALQSKPVYIGAGEADPNLMPAFKAAATYRRYGATVTYEVYFGKGHAMPEAVPQKFKAWLESAGKYYAGAMNDALRKELDEQLNALLREALAKPDALARYNAMAALGLDPRLAVCTSSLADDIGRQVRVARISAPGREEGLVEKAFFDLAWQDINIKSLHDLKTVRDGFKKLGAAYPETFLGKYAVKYHECLAQMYQKALESVPGNQKTAKPGAVSSPVSDGRVRPPVIKYNKP